MASMAWISNRSERSSYTLRVSAERCFTRAGDTIFVSSPYCCFYSIIAMNILENREDDDFESYDFLWILWISCWAKGLPVNNFCFELG